MKDKQELIKEIQQDLETIKEKLNIIVDKEQPYECAFYFTYKKDGRKIIHINNIILNIK
jgi:hypothetical protein